MGRAGAARLTAVLLASAMACGPAGEPVDGPAAGPGSGPHIVLISLDTLRADHLGSYGYARPTSPHLDVFAEEAWLFEDVIAPSNNTAPSHASLFTGVIVPVHGVDHRRPGAPPDALPMLAERLRDAGWSTQGLADGGFVSEEFGLDRGFEAFESRLGPLAVKLPRWLDLVGRPTSRPTFLFLHTYDTHAPYVPLAEHDLFTDPGYDGVFRGRVTAYREAFERGRHSDRLPLLSRLFWEDDKDRLDAEDLTYLEGLYDGEIRQLDALLGRLFESLRREGWYDSAWIVVTSDHGEAFGEHGSTEHRQLYLEELRVPLLIRPPGGLPSPGPVRIPGPVRLVDVPPTLLDAVGLPAPPDLDGVSLLPRARRPTARHPDLPAHSVAGEAPEHRSLIVGGAKLTAHAVRAPVFHDLRADPGEREGLTTDRAPPWASELLERLAEIEREAQERRARLSGDVAPDGSPGKLSPHTLEELERLGYTGGRDH